MSKIILNPDLGASISNVTYEGVAYFADKNFEPGSVFKFEDERTADFFLDTFRFLTEISVEEAKKILGTPALKCEQCDYTTRNKGSLTAHLKKHAAEAELDEIGIPVVRQTNKQRDVATTINNDVQKEIDEEGKQFRDGYPGLTEGEGLTTEQVSRGAVMS